MKSLLIVDDDADLADALSRAMEKRGFAPVVASNAVEAQRIIDDAPPAFAIIDLRIGEDNGIDVIDALVSVREDARAVIMSGYGDLTTAVAAAKAGAIDFLPKPSDADDLEKALTAPLGAHAAPPDNAMTPDEIRWAHIERVYDENERNISKTARKLSMHRRTLQRMLSKRDDETPASA